jgi:hypothetical protein
VGLFELPATLPSNYTHWRDIRWYRVLVVDTDFPPRFSGSRQVGHRGPVFDPKPPAVTVRFANPGTRDPSFKIDLGQSLLVAEITLAGVVECRIRLGVFTRSHNM